jgi:hypothetical protein
VRENYESDRVLESREIYFSLFFLHFRKKKYFRNDKTKNHHGKTSILITGKITLKMSQIWQSLLNTKILLSNSNFNNFFTVIKILLIRHKFGVIWVVCINK